MGGTFEGLLDRAARAADAAEVYWRRVSSTPVSFENNKLKEMQTNESLTVALRVVKGGRLGFSTTTKDGDWPTLVDNAVAAAAFGGPADFDFAPKAPPSKVDIYDPKVASLPLEDMVDTGRGIIEAINAYDPAVLAGAQVRRAVQEAGVMNTAGFAGDYKRTEYTVYAFGHLVEGQTILDVYDGDGATTLDIDVRAMWERVIRDLRIGRIGVPIKSGKYTAILTPNAVSDLLTPFTEALNGRAVQRGISPWRDKLGQGLFDPGFTLYDDTTLAHEPSSAGFDDEGVPTRRTCLIDRGRINSFFHDLRTAKALGQVPTGNGWRRTPDSPPAAAAGNLVVAPGERSFDSLLKDVRDGVLVDQLMGAWAGNLLAGEVNGNVMLGFKVENGRPMGRIKDCMFSVNAFEALRNQLVAVSRETKRTFTGVLPWIVLDGVSISAKA